MSTMNHVRLTTDKNDLSDDVISYIRRNKSLSIYNGVKKSILPDLSKVVKDINGFKLIIILRDDLLGNSSINGLDILEFLPGINHLHILVHQATPLFNIDALNYINDLRSFKISGYLKKNIDFGPLRKFNKISTLYINDLIFPNKYYDIINNNPIENLSLRKISLSDLDKKNSIKNLEVLNELIDEQMLAFKFPKISQLTLINGKKLSDFSFLSNCLNLERLDINTIKGLVSIPKLKSEKLHTLQILNCKNLEDIHHIYDLKNLKNLAITFSKVNFEDVSNIFSKLSLHNFYFISNKNKENEMFENLAIKHQINNSAM
ncbi:hypothetical protein [Neisseria dentiae]|uniref:hypothetical protein n=1 Tax=Neisseria dentiae TaxID=194197 RepID=UPI0035A1B323